MGPIHTVRVRRPRAKWHIGNNEDTVLQADVLDLTKDEAPVTVKFATGQTQQWRLVNLSSPEDDASSKD